MIRPETPDDLDAMEAAVDRYGDPTEADQQDWPRWKGFNP